VGNAAEQADLECRTSPALDEIGKISTISDRSAFDLKRPRLARRTFLAHTLSHAKRIPANNQMPYVGHGVGYALYLGVAVNFVLSFVLTGSAIAQPKRSEVDGIVPISATFCADMRTHHVLNGAVVGCDRLRLVRFSYFGFDDHVHDDGEIVVMDAAASHVLRIFGKLKKIRFPIFKARPMNDFDGDDNASMRANNSSAFNDRNLTGGDSISLHAYGLAIDLNPVQNPYLARSGTMLKIEPPAGADYLNRLSERPWKRPRRGMAELVVRIFANEGFIVWGGYWDDPIDYQHFQVPRKLAERLASLSPSEATKSFDRVVDRFQACERKHRLRTLPDPNCLVQVDPTVDAAAGSLMSLTAKHQ
jgi:D-alanyl-D-alanine carboxypeptidase